MDPQQPQPEPVLNQPPAPGPLPSAPENSPPEQQLDGQQESPVAYDTQADGHQMEAISWEASESVHHEKDTVWFIGVLVVAALLSMLSIFFIKSWTFTLLIVVMVIALVVFAKRPPRLMQYQMTEHGIDVNGIHHSFREFRAFGVVQDGPFYYVSLLPIKRFMPAMDVYFPEEHGEDIVDLLGSKIPIQTIKPDMLDMVTKRIRF